MEIAPVPNGARRKDLFSLPLQLRYPSLLSAPQFGKLLHGSICIIGIVFSLKKYEYVYVFCTLFEGPTR